MKEDKKCGTECGHQTARSKKSENERLAAKMEALRLQAAPTLIHDLATSCASFIAAIDGNSCDVAAYLEQRLAPLIPMIRIDERVRAAIERIARDGRQLKRP